MLEYARQREAVVDMARDDSAPNKTRRSTVLVPSYIGKVVRGCHVAERVHTDLLHVSVYTECRYAKPGRMITGQHVACFDLFCRRYNFGIGRIPQRLNARGRKYDRPEHGCKRHEHCEQTPFHPVLSMLRAARTQERLGRCREFPGFFEVFEDFLVANLRERYIPLADRHEFRRGLKNEDLICLALNTRERILCSD